MWLRSVLANWNIRKWSRPCQEKKKHYCFAPKGFLVLSQARHEIVCLQEYGEKEESAENVEYYINFVNSCQRLFFEPDLITWRFNCCFWVIMFKGVRKAPINSPTDNVLSSGTLKPHYRNDLQIFISCSSVQGSSHTSHKTCPVLKLYGYWIAIRKCICLTSPLKWNGVYLHKVYGAVLLHPVSIQKTVHLNYPCPRLLLQLYKNYIWNTNSFVILTQELLCFLI